MSSEETWLIQSMGENQIWSNLCVWWAPNSRGYVTDVARAGRYTRDEAESVEHSSPGDNRAVPEAIALSLCFAVVDTCKLRDAMAKRGGA